MVEANQFLSRLRIFAESFTGCPVRVITPRSLLGQEAVQLQDSLRIEIPSSIELLSQEKKEEIALKTYKGLVALQASAVLYQGVPSYELGIYRDQNKINESKNKLSELAGRLSMKTSDRKRDEIEYQKLLKLLEKVEIMNTSLDKRFLLSSCLSTIELSRRMLCIQADYPILFEDIKEGFMHVFNPELLKKALVRESTDEKNRKVYTTNEIDLAISRIYLENLGVDRTSLESIIQEIPVDFNLGNYREQLARKMEELTHFPLPFESSYDDSITRAIEFKKFVEDIMGRNNLGSPFVSSLDSEYLAFIQRERILKEEERLKQEMAGFDTKLIEKHSVYLHTARTGAIDYMSARSSSEALSRTFQDVLIERAVQIEIPESFEKGEIGKTFYFSEMREGILAPRAVRVIVHDLVKNQPMNEEQYKRQQQLEALIETLEEKAKKHDQRIRSDVFYIYNPQEEIKGRSSAERKIKSAKRQLKVSRKLHEKISKKEIEINSQFVKRIEREMEKIKPVARSIVRGCFEGELDEKKYYDWWLENLTGGNPIPNFYYQWQKRRRDVASILLLDASHSVNRLAQDDRTVLDIIKEAAYYFTIAAHSLEDRVAVISYNGKGPMNSRVFLLKDFMDEPRILRERMELLKGELNNRDGSAIRYATRLLSKYPAKTRFLFHLGDMLPSDLEDTTDAFSYEGAYALEDVTHAFRSARTYGIVPYGICIMKSESEKKEDKPVLVSGKLNRKLLAKIQEQRAKTAYILSDEILQRNFRRNYKIVNNIGKLPQVLKEAYLQVSFNRF